MVFTIMYDEDTSSIFPKNECSSLFFSLHPVITNMIIPHSIIVNVFSSYRSVLCCFSSFFIVGWEAVLRIGSSFVPQIGRKYLHRKFVIS